jgi:TRAP-type C4-dicarboxylate transport system permease small subunit
MRTALDRLYLAAGALAGLCLIAIAVLVLLSVITRLMGLYVPGLTVYAGYAMATSSFLALAYTFAKGGHIRVSLFIEKLAGRRRRAAELWCLAVGTFLAGYLGWYAVKMVRVSHMLGDVSEGADATPLWIPQIGMAAGSVLLTLALADRLVAVARGAPLAPRPAAPEDTSHPEDIVGE